MKITMKKRSGMRWTAFPLSILILSPPVQAAEIFEFYSGVRQMGMGGAYAAVVNDETALLQNPAGLGKLRDTTVTIADPELSLGSRNTDIATASDLGRVFSFSGIQSASAANPDKPWHTKAQVFPSIVAPNFGIGLHAKWETNAETISATNKFRLDYTNDYALALGFCFRFWDGIIKLGVSGRAVNRAEIHKDIDPSTTDISVQSQGAEGGGVGTDVGLILTAPVAGLPSLAAVAHDVGHTAYTLSNGMFNSTTSRPEITKQTIDVGFSVSPILSNRVRMQFTGEYRDVQTLSEEPDQMRRLHVGAEINMADFFFLRAGLNQRYWTAGFEFTTEQFQLQAATYGEEIGTAAAPREGRRFMGKFSLRF